MKNRTAKTRFFSLPRRSKKAFTLPEVIVGISILVMVIMSSTNLLVSIVRSNNVNVHTLVAYELAQEGLEGVRNIRDSNWLLNAEFSGVIGGKSGSKIQIWGTQLPNVVDQNAHFYLLDYNRFSPASDTLSAEELKDDTPWKLTELSSNVDPEKDPSVAQLFEHKLALNNGEIVYIHAGSATEDTKSIYSRYLKIQALGYGEKTDKVYKYRVTSVVTWFEDNQNKNVRLTEELTNWKDGPL